jgi:hypothetical protein
MKSEQARFLNPSPYVQGALAERTREASKDPPNREYKKSGVG